MRQAARGTDGSLREIGATAGCGFALSESWRQPPERPELGVSETHVWAFGTDVTRKEAESLGGLLSPDERNRAERLRVESDRQRFVAGRGLLRVILARYLGQSPGVLHFDYTPLGKPSLTAARLAGLRFNASASGSVGVVALRRGCEMGVDVELIREVPEAVARRALTSAEWGAFDSLTEAERSAHFFQYWTGKEAVTKCLGRGLRQSFAELSLPGDCRTDPRRVQLENGARTEVAWLLQLAPPRTGYAAALAAAAPFGEVRLWSLAGPPGA
jgi:4'-phosphopantetheinyl transferase